jgi:hypothetical protein
MPYRKSSAVADNRPAVISRGNGAVTVVPFSFTATVSPSEPLILNDVIGLAKLPAEHVLVDFFIDLPDLDSGTTLVWSAGVHEMDGSTVVDVDALVAGSTVGRTAGNVRMSSAAALTLAASERDRVVTLTVTTAPTGGTSATPITGWVSYRPVSFDDVVTHDDTIN